jgi:hypothetical protein
MGRWEQGAGQARRESYGPARSGPHYGSGLAVPLFWLVNKMASFTDNSYDRRHN